LDNSPRPAVDEFPCAMADWGKADSIALTCASTGTTVEIQRLEQRPVNQQQTIKPPVNETLPPPLQPKNSGLAVWSLVLGILSLTLCSLFAGIPAVICGHMASSRISRSGGRLAGNGLAIAGLITGYISIAFGFIVIPLLVAIAIPNFVKARNTAQHNICLNNMRMIDAAKQQWALENHKGSSDVPTWSDLRTYLHDQPLCPAGGSYSINSAGTTPSCSQHGALE
jgi:hypothetical protein